MCPGLGCAVAVLFCVLWLQGNLGQVAITEEPAGSSHSVLAVMHLCVLAFYLKVQLGVLMWTSFLLDLWSSEQSCFLVGKSCNSSNKGAFHGPEVCVDWRSIPCCCWQVWKDIGLSSLCCAHSSKWHFKHCFIRSESLCYCCCNKPTPSST